MTPNESLIKFEKKCDHKELAGSRIGLIPKYLNQKNVTEHPEKSGHYPWDIDVSDLIELFKPDLHGGNALFINANPNSLNNNDPEKKKLFTLFKIEHIYGYSAYQWTPIMLKLKEIFVEKDVTEDPSFVEKFALSEAGYSKAEFVYTFLYLNGWIEKGEFKGPWSFPRNSPTNSTLLWRYAWEYFHPHIRY